MSNLCLLSHIVALISNTKQRIWINTCTIITAIASHIGHQYHTPIIRLLPCRVFLRVEFFKFRLLFLRLTSI